MSKHKDEKHRHEHPAAEWSLGHEERKSAPDDPAQSPVELGPDPSIAPQSSELAALREQIEDSVRLQRENLLRELLPITDNLERAVDAARGGGNGKPIVEGVDMVLRSLLDFLRAQGVTPRESVGQPFDPQFHEAVDHVESGEHPPNTVISEFHRGYQVGDRVLRPARAAVAKAVPRDGPPGKNGEDDGGVENN